MTKKTDKTNADTANAMKGTKGKEAQKTQPPKRIRIRRAEECPVNAKATKTYKINSCLWAVRVKEEGAQDGDYKMAAEIPCLVVADFGRVYKTQAEAIEAKWRIIKAFGTPDKVKDFDAKFAEAKKNADLVRSLREITASENAKKIVNAGERVYVNKAKDNAKKRFASIVAKYGEE